MATMTGLGHDCIKRMREQYASQLRPNSQIFLKRRDIKAAEVSNRIVTTLATTDDIDLDHEIVVPSGCDMTVYKQNRRNFADHRYDVANHVAMMRSCNPYPTAKNFRGWINRSEFLTGLKNPLAQDLLTVAKSEGIACSIGFEVVEASEPRDIDPPHYQKAEYIVRQCRVIELSFTFMPCNVACQSLEETQNGDLEQRMAVLEDLVVKGRGHGGIDLEAGIALGLRYRKHTAVRTPAKTRPRRSIIIED